MSGESVERSQFLRAGLKRGLTEDMALLQLELVADTPCKVKLSFGLRRLLEEEKQLKAINQAIQDSLEGDELAEDCYQEGRFFKEIGLLSETITARLKIMETRDSLSNPSRASFRSITPAPSRAFPDAQEHANLRIVDSWHVNQHDSRRSILPSREESPFALDTSPEGCDQQARQEIGQERKTTVSRKPPAFWKEFRRPTVEARKFNGKDVAEWPEFWDWFCAGVDNDPELPDCAKLHYLKNSLEGDALRTINGLRITDDNYKIALDRLFDKYANTELIIQSHVNHLLGLRKFELQGPKSLRKLLEKIEFHVRALEDLGRSPDSYSTIFIPILASLLPDEINLLWTRRRCETGDFSLKTMLKFLKSEATIRESAGSLRLPVDQGSNKNWDNKKILPTAAALNTASKKRFETCGFCKNKDCNPTTCDEGLKLSVEDRLQRLKENGGCFRCMHRGHLSKD